MKKIMLVITVICLGLIATFFLLKESDVVIINPNPKSENSWVGDVMPFHDGKQWQIFYLEDHRDGEIGFHPFSLFQTNDFVEYKDKGIVIPYINEELSQERALGTGSIIKDKEGLYHAFYTAHNGSLDIAEAIMHATSKNLTKWDKKTDEMFYGDSQYQRNDFRDPFVIFNEEEQKYWMLITTRKDDRGVIAKYTSTDLSNWEDEGVFFENDLGTDGNLECPSMVFYKGKWYLSFSDQWPDRVTHYRVSDSMNGPFEKPTGLDHWDSNAFYAGQIQKDSEDQLFVFAWVPTKENHDDNKGYNWAGNLVVHKLKQNSDGSLSAQVPDSVREFYESKNAPTVSPLQDSAIRFKQNDTQTYIKGSVEFDEDSEFGFSFNSKDDYPSQLNIMIQDSVISYHNNYLKYIDSSTPLTKLQISDPTSFDFELFINGEIITFYINGEHAFTNRLLLAKDNDFDFFVRSGNATLKLD